MTVERGREADLISRVQKAQAKRWAEAGVERNLKCENGPEVGQDEVTVRVDAAGGLGAAYGVSGLPSLAEGRGSTASSTRILGIYKTE